MKPIQIPVTWDAANRKKDRSVGLRFTSNLEISNTDFATMDNLVNQSGWLLFSGDTEIDMKNVPRESAPVDIGQKKPSQRLRAVLYRIWEQKTDQSEPFETHYYVRIMEKIIERYKEELE